MLDVPQTEQYRPIQEALAAIDSVMVLPLMPTIPVQVVSAIFGGGDGAYVRQGVGLPLRIEIAEDAEYPELTTAHEFGHYLDDCGFLTADGWASEVDPRLEALRQAWEKTDAVHILRAALETDRITVILPHGGLAEFPLMQEEGENCRYYLQGRELFARSYAQYVAVKSRNRVLLDQVSLRRAGVEGRFYRVQWAESDFQVIAEAFDEILEALGWLR